MSELDEATEELDVELARQVSRIASKVKDSNPYWICTPAGEYETNNGSDWCEECGPYMFRHLRKKDRKNAESYYLDGGWRVESDTHSFCAHCGCWLRISLTDHGVEQELSHYHENGINHDAIVDEAYSIDLLMNAVWRGDQIKEVQTLARELVANEASRPLNRHKDQGQ